MKKNRTSNKTSKRIIEATEKQAKAVRLRIEGYTHQQIADKLGYEGRQGACDAVQAALKKTLKEPADDYRKLELERLDMMFQAIWDDVTNGKVNKIDRALKIMERRSKLLGLDAPIKGQIDGDIGLTAVIMQVMLEMEASGELPGKDSNLLENKD